MKKMFRVLALLLALTVALPCAASADGFTENSTLKAYWSLVSGAAAEDTPSARLLKQVLDGAFDLTADQNELADALPLLAEITSQDLALFAGQSKMPVEMVRHAYYMALANSLSAEIDRNPAADEQYRNLQLVLQLFLSARDDDSESMDRERDAIRTIISREEV